MARGKVTFHYTQPLSYEKPHVDANGDALTLSPAHQQRRDTHALSRCTQDSSLVSRLSLAPHLAVNLFASDKRAIVTSGTRKTVFTGRIFLDLLPLLAKGEHIGEQLVQTLTSKHTDMQVRTALYHLIAKNILVSSEHSLTATQALFWANAGLSPCMAQKRLASLPLHVASLTDEPFPAQLLAKLQEFGWQHVAHAEDAELLLYRVNSYLQVDIAAINARHLADGKRWLLLQLGEESARCGPLFCSAAHPVISNRPCWECLRVRMAEGDGNVEEFLRKHKHQHLPRPPTHMSSHLSEALSACLLAEMGALLQDDEVVAPLRSHMLSLALPQMTCEYHWVAQRPQCRVCCEDETQWNAERAPQALQLKAQPALSSVSGGTRVYTPQAVFEHYRKHVSPLTGAVDKIEHCVGTYHDEGGNKWDWLHNSVSGKNRSLQMESFDNLRKSFRANTCGKGISAIQSYVGAVCEAFERSAFLFSQRGEIYRQARCGDFKDGEAIAPNDIALFSETQYRHREAINAQRHNFYFVPQPFDLEQETLWTPVWSLSAARHKYLATCSLYFGIRGFEGISKYRYACSNGIAGGATLEEAILQGFYELLERDACAIWWYNRLRLPPVDLEKFDLPWLQRAKTFYAAMQRELWVLDMTSDLGVPCCVALSRHTQPDRPEAVLLGFGAHVNQTIAVVRAISEMNQLLIAYEVSCPQEQDFATWVRKNHPTADADWLLKVRTADPSASWLLPDTGERESGKECGEQAQDYPCPQFSDLLEEINYLRAIVENKGMEVLVYDMTRADVDYHVAKVIVPGLRHFWCRLAPGRLYDVPVARGQLARPHREEEMNPIAMFV